MAASLELPQTRLTKYLKTLIDLDILEREVPITEENPDKSKKGLYKIKDNYLKHQLYLSHLKNMYYIQHKILQDQKEKQILLLYYNHLYD